MIFFLGLSNYPNQPSHLGADTDILLQYIENENKLIDSHIFSKFALFFFKVSIFKEENSVIVYLPSSRLNSCPKGYHNALTLINSVILSSKYVFIFPSNATVEQMKIFKQFILYYHPLGEKIVH